MYVYDRRVRQPSGVFNAVTMSKTINAFILRVLCSYTHIRTCTRTGQRKKIGIAKVLVLVWY